MSEKWKDYPRVQKHQKDPRRNWGLCGRNVENQATTTLINHDQDKDKIVCRNSVPQLGWTNG